MLVSGSGPRQMSFKSGWMSTREESWDGGFSHCEDCEDCEIACIPENGHGRPALGLSLALRENGVLLQRLKGISMTR